MKKKPNPVVQTVLEQLQPHGPITARAMFGGYGIYYEKVMFAAIFMDRLYFRVDHYNKEEYLQYKSQPFIYESAGKRIMLPYFSLPDEIAQNPELLELWIHKSYEAAVRYKIKKNKKTKSLSEL